MTADQATINELIDQVITQTVPGQEACESGVWQCRLCRDRRCAERDPKSVGMIVETGADRIGTSPGVKRKPEVAALIDHTLLKPDATEDDLVVLCEEAAKYGFASVCVNPVWVGFCKELLKDTNVMVATVIGFPLGALPSAGKAAETVQAVSDGADELDMVLNVGFLKSGKYAEAEDDIRQVVQAAGALTVKVIIETALLSDEEKVKACVLAQRAGAKYVKTSTGFSKGGATEHDIAIMRRVVGPAMGVKASGGIKSRADVDKMIEAGATRIGASASVAIVSNGSAGASAY